MQTIDSNADPKSQSRRFTMISFKDKMQLLKELREKYDSNKSRIE